MENSAKAAYNYALRLLARQDYSKYKLTQKLKLRKHTDQEIEQTIQRLEELGYLREENYTRSYVKKLVRKNLAPQLIQRKCQEEKLNSDPQLIQDLYDELQTGPEEQIKVLFTKRLKSYSSSQIQNMEREELFKLRQKLLSQALQRGHDFATSKKVLQQILQGLESDEFELE